MLKLISSVTYHRIFVASLTFNDQNIWWSEMDLPYNNADVIVYNYIYTNSGDLNSLILYCSVVQIISASFSEISLSKLQNFAPDIEPENRF